MATPNHNTSLQIWIVLSVLFLTSAISVPQTPETQTPICTLATDNNHIFTFQCDGGVKTSRRTAKIGTVHISNPGLYQIIATVAYSDNTEEGQTEESQTEESFYIILTDSSSGDSIPPIDANTKDKQFRIVQDDSTEGPTRVHAGYYCLESGGYDLELNHLRKLFLELQKSNQEQTIEDFLNSDFLFEKWPHSVDLVELSLSLVETLKLTKTSSADSVIAGDGLTYALQLSIDSPDTLLPDTLLNVIVKDSLPDFVEFIGDFQETGPDSLSADSTVLFWRFESLPKDSTLMMNYRVSVAPADSFQSLPSMLINMSTATSSCGTASASDTVYVSIQGSCRLRLLKSADADTVAPDDSITYTLQLKNSGPDSTGLITLTDELPVGVIYIKDSVSVEPEIDGQKLIWDLDSLAPGDSLDLPITYNVKVADRGSFAMLPHLLVNGSTAISSCSTVSAQDTVIVVAPCVLSLKKAAFERRVEPGDTINYSITLENTGERTVSNVILRDTLPNLVKYVPDLASVHPPDSVSTDNALFWEYNSLAPGEMLNLTYKVQVAAQEAFETLPDSLVNGSTLTSSCGTVSVRDTVIVDPPCELNLTKETISRTVNPGETITYRIALENKGLETVSNITLWDALPDSVDFDPASVTPAPLNISADGDSLFWRFAGLSPGEIVWLTYKVNVANYCPALPDTLENISSATSDCGSDTARAIVIVSNENCPKEESCLILSQNVFAPGDVDDLKMKFELASESPVTIDLYDITGYHVTNILDGESYPPGKQTYPWTGRTKDGFKVGSGVYIILFLTQTLECMRKVIVVQ